ncbi:MAG: hypothetical protein ACRDRH_27030 [Pseudonocardia sp.]
MTTKALLAIYGAVLLLLTGVAYAAGSAVGPFSPTAGGHSTGHGGGPGHGGAAVEHPGGLASSSGGYQFTPVDDAQPGFVAGTTKEFAYRITGSDGAAVTAFDVEHDKRMHLIVVRRDTTGFQHVHPEMAADGTWRVPLTLPAAGTYRAFADFTPTGGGPRTLGVDLFAPGTFEPVAHRPTRIAEVDGYTVELAGEPIPGEAAPLTLTVRKDGRPVTDLEPYLAAYGHLVALRESDLAYLHVHPAARNAGGALTSSAAPDGRTPAGPDIEFITEVPTTGSYRLFLDFAHGGVVRTAEFTVATPGHSGH